MNEAQIADRLALQEEQILGIRFFNGGVKEAVARMATDRGLLVAPSGTCFERLLRDEAYRRAVTSADVALPDSGAMVALWQLVKGRSVNRISGLAYIKALVATPELRAGRTLWVLPHERARERLLSWAAGAGLVVNAADCYLAPMYAAAVTDEALVRLVNTAHPSHIVVGIGAGPQEKLGWYLRENTASRPAIHCIGGALGFVTGDQVAIPDWADRLYLGWFLRLLSNPSVFIPRLAKAASLPFLIARYGAKLPPLK